MRIERLGEFLDLDADAIGTIGGGHGKPKGKLNVAMVQSLARSKRLDELLAGYRGRARVRRGGLSAHLLVICFSANHTCWRAHS